MPPAHGRYDRRTHKPVPRRRAVATCCDRGRSELRLQLQLELAGSRPGLTKASGVERDTAWRIQVETPAGQLKASPQQFRIRPGALHACTKIRIVVAAATRVAHERHHMARALRIVLCQPFAKEVF